MLRMRVSWIQLASMPKAGRIRAKHRCGPLCASICTLNMVNFAADWGDFGETWLLSEGGRKTNDLKFPSGAFFSITAD